MRSTKDIDRRLLGSFLVVAAVIVALLAAALAAPADAQGKPDGRGSDGTLAARLAALEEQVADQGAQLADQGAQLAEQGEQLAEQGEQLADQGQQLAQLAATADSQAARLVTLETLVAAFADAACPADEVVVGFAGGAPACAPVRTLTSADSGATIAVGADGVEITGADGSHVKLDGSGVSIRSTTALALRGTTAVLEGDATTTVRGGATARVEAGGTTEIRGAMVQLGSSSGCQPVARLGDQVVGGTIITGAATIMAC